MDSPARNSGDTPADDLVPVGLESDYYALCDDVLHGRLAPGDFAAGWERIKREKLRAERENPLEQALTLRDYQRALRRQTQLLRLDSHRVVRFDCQRRPSQVRRQPRSRRVRTARRARSPGRQDPDEPEPPWRFYEHSARVDDQRIAWTLERWGDEALEDAL